jgi:tRNA A-37 threonylcarbamoyl transferase component Bud32
VLPDEKLEFGEIGKYRVLAKIGQGAMGEVYKAHDPVLGRFVAIKTISKGINPDEQAKQRFQREAQSAAALNHPNIITVYDFGEEQGTIYMAMELLEGTDLRELIEKKALTSIAQKLKIMEEICEGLAFAHGKGVTHRDLKPGNIHILPSGHVKIMDFGLARRSEDAARTSVIMGTPYYMAPEQAQGERTTARSDVFALGSVFYELLSGRRPFTGDSIPAVLFSVVHREPDALSKWVSDAPALVAVVERALSKDAGKRYPDGAAVREALHAAREALFGGPPGGGRPPAGLRQEPAKPLPMPLSEAPETDPDLREALLELEQYLTDRLPPLMVADSVTRVLDAPAEAVAADLFTWAIRQSDAQSAPLGDLLFHALRKLHVMGEFGLVDPKALEVFLENVGRAALEYCPPEDRSRLRKSLTRLGESEMMRTGPIGLMHTAVEETLGGADRTLAGASATSSMGAAALPNSLRRLSLLEQRLKQQDLGAEAEGEEDQASRSQLISQTLTAAASQAENERELEENLRRLRAFGVASGKDQIFRSIGQGLSDWVLPPDVAELSAGKPFGAEVEAMRRIISLAEEPIEMARRFRHLVYAAIEQFNQGNLGRAVQMFELAIQLNEEKKIDPGFVETVRRKGHESVDQSRLRHFLEKPEYHFQLRMVLNFFSFGLGHESLLDELQVEERRERRRFLLDLLEVHGAPARRLARERLQATVEGGEDSGPHIQRNWIYLMRSVPRPLDEPPEPEIDLVLRFATPGHGLFLMREAVTYVGQVKHVKARQSLVALLHAYEAECSRTDGSPEDRQEWDGALDKICGALARFGTPAAWHAVLDHALSRQAHLGSTMNRLSELGGQDLTASPEVLERLFAEMRNTLPRGVLGFLGSKKDHDLMCLIEAVSGTPSAEVRAALEDLAGRFPTQTIGKAAARVLEGLRRPPQPSSQDQQGELDSFGLPSLLHRLSQSRATGTLTLADAAGPRASLAFDGGRIRRCRHGRLEGEGAMYQLVERPFAGTYVFQGGAPVVGGPPMPDVTSLILEGVRRSGELQRANALVPEDATLQATGQSPSPVPDESDYNLVVALWEKACAGIPPRQMEADLEVDSFRIRRPLAHWLEEGALRLVTPLA